MCLLGASNIQVSWNSGRGKILAVEFERWCWGWEAMGKKKTL